MNRIKRRKAVKYTAEFKREAVKLAQSSDKRIYQTAQDLGMNEKTLYNWVAIAMRSKPKDNMPSKASEKPSTNTKHRYQELEEENAKLKKELARAQMERDILKKAAAYFASQEL